jgi:hypothetical protein
MTNENDETIKSSQRINELENLFSYAAKTAANSFHTLKSLDIKKVRTDDLKNHLEYFNGNPEEGITGELEEMANFNEEYWDLTGKRNHGYAMYSHYANLIAGILEKEKNVREVWLADFDGRVW